MGNKHPVTTGLCSIEPPPPPQIDNACNTLYLKGVVECEKVSYPMYSLLKGCMYMRASRRLCQLLLWDISGNIVRGGFKVKRPS